MQPLDELVLDRTLDFEFTHHQPHIKDDAQLSKIKTKNQDAVASGLFFLFIHHLQTCNHARVCQSRRISHGLSLCDIPQ